MKTRKWTKISEGLYLFTLGDVEIGELKINHNSLDTKAECNIRNEIYTIKRTGFWKNNIEVLDKNGFQFAKTYNEKWYASSSLLEFNNKKYNLKLHNNPLAELCVLEKEKIILAYGLNTDKQKIGIKITSSIGEGEIILDFILWYLFVPIATENSGDNFIFSLLSV